MNILNVHKTVEKINNKFRLARKRKQRLNYPKIGITGLIVIILFTTVVTGCSGYRYFTFKNIIADCSFEYPASYNITSINKGELGVGAWVFLIPKSKPEEGELMLIAVMETSVDSPDYRTSIERALQGVQEKQRADEFKLENRSQIIIDGVQGEQIIYRFVLNDNPGSIGKPEPFLAIAFEAYFQKDDVIWTIWSHVLADKFEQAKADFEHILQTFKFLE